MRRIEYENAMAIEDRSIRWISEHKKLIRQFEETHIFEFTRELYESVVDAEATLLKLLKIIEDAESGEAWPVTKFLLKRTRLQIENELKRTKAITEKCREMRCCSRDPVKC